MTTEKLMPKTTGYEIGQQIIEASASFKPPLNGAEVAAIGGMLLGIYPSSPEDADLRYNIVQASYHVSNGEVVSERLAALNGLLNELR